VNLAQGNQSQRFSFSRDFPNEGATIAFYRLPIVRGGKPKVELAATICFRETSDPRAKSVDDTRELREIRGSDDLDFGSRTPLRRFPGGYSGRHTQL
jgi:hypothetical protein